MKGKIVSFGIIIIFGFGYLALKTGLHIVSLSRETTLISVFAFVALLLVVLFARSQRSEHD